ncbi:MAG TPA: hypothetical protein VHF06_23435 [Pseudonocardiaceae bacterium]|nr:hypothetical protein [Pseudonocardiaceae bacterium]
MTVWMPPTPGFHLDPALVTKLTADRLDDDGQAELADQMAVLIMCHVRLPTAVAVRLARVVRHLGGDGALVDWLERFPGRPRITTRLLALIDLLNTVSAEPAVVTALTELRRRTPDPSELRPYLSPDTDDETLAGLAWHIEGLAGDDRLADATALALASAELLRGTAHRARELNPTVPDLAEPASRAAAAVAEAVAG